MAIRVLLADDHPATCAGLRATLDAAPDEVVGRLPRTDPSPETDRTIDRWLHPSLDGTPPVEKSC